MNSLTKRRLHGHKYEKKHGKCSVTITFEILNHFKYNFDNVFNVEVYWRSLLTMHLAHKVRLQGEINKILANFL